MSTLPQSELRYEHLTQRALSEISVDLSGKSIGTPGPNYSLISVIEEQLGTGQNTKSEDLTSQASALQREKPRFSSL